MCSAVRQDHIVVNQVGAVTTIALDRASKRNALNEAMLLELDDALVRVGRDPSIAAVILTSTDPVAFCAGGDLREVVAAEPEVRQRIVEQMHRTRWRLVTLPQPTIAAVAGYAHGAGAELATACDLCIVAESAQFRFAGAAVGRVSGTQRLPRMVGLARAKEIVFSARIVSAAEAERIGLAIRMVPTDRLQATAQELAQLIAANDRRVVAESKRLLNETFGDDHRVGYEKEADALRASVRRSTDAEAPFA